MRALDRVIALIEAVAEHQGPMTASAAASRVGLSLSTASRIIRELAEQGLLERSGANGTYSLGSRLLAIARAAREPHQLLSTALPVMEALRDATKETVSLHVRVGTNRVCIAEIQSRLPVRRVVPLGFSVSLHYGATGEVLLSGVSHDELDALLNAIGLPEEEQNELRARLDRVRRDGWAMAVDAWTEGVSGLAAPIHDGHTVVAALVASGPSFRWTPTMMFANVDNLLAAAKQISEGLVPGAPVTSDAGAPVKSRHTAHPPGSAAPARRYPQRDLEGDV